MTILWTFLGFFYFWIAITFLRAKWFMVSPPNPPGKLKATLLFATYDMWIGVYTKTGKDKAAYWFPLPCLGVKYYRDPS